MDSGNQYSKAIQSEFYQIPFDKLDLPVTKHLNKTLFGENLQSKYNGLPVKIKIFSLNNWSPENFYLQAKLFKLASSHPNCIRMYGVTKPNDSQWKFGTVPPYVIITEAGRGNVEDFLKSDNMFHMAPGEIDYHLIVRIGLNVVRGIRHFETLYSQFPNLHLLIQARAIDLKTDLTAFLAEYENGYLPESCRTTNAEMEYVPPDSVMFNKVYSFEMSRNIWSFGIFLFQICTGKYQRPPLGESALESIRNYIDQKPIQIPPTCHTSMSKIIRLCLNYDVEDRLSSGSLDKIENLLERHYQEVKPSYWVPSLMYSD